MNRYYIECNIPSSAKGSWVRAHHAERGSGSWSWPRTGSTTLAIPQIREVRVRRHGFDGKKAWTWTIVDLLRPFARYPQGVPPDVDLRGLVTPPPATR